MINRSIRVRSWLPLTLVAILLVLQIFSPARAILFVLITMGAVVVISYLWVWQLARGVSVQRLRRYGWAQVGDVIQERWIMHNDAWLPVLWAEVQELSDLVGYDARRAIGMSARSSQQWTTRGTCRMRGVFTLGPLYVTMGDPFGLFAVRLFDPHQETFVVYPAVAALPDLLQQQGAERGSGRASARSQTFTTNASSIRPYVWGDALKRIHWRSTAKRSVPGMESLQVKEFDREPSGDLWIVLDMHRDVHVGRGQESTEEYAVTLAASLAGQMLRSNRAVGMIVSNADAPILVPPRKGHEQLWELLRVLARVYAVSEVPLHDLLLQAGPVLSRNMTLTVVTPSADSAWIEGLGMLLTRSIVPTALLLDGATFDGGPSMEGVRGALADIGVPAHVIGKGYGPVAQVAQSRQAQFKVLGSGRVVAVNPREESDWVPVGVREGDVS